MTANKTTTFSMPRETYEKFRGLLGDASASQVIADVIEQLANGLSVTLSESLERSRNARRRGRPPGQPDTYQRTRRGRTPRDAERSGAASA